MELIILLLIIIVLLIIGILMYKGGLEIKEVIWGLLLTIFMTFIIGFTCYLIKKGSEQFYISFRE